jgi:hypothetical protein
MPGQNWLMVANSPISGAGQGAGSALSDTATGADLSPLPQFNSQTWAAMYAGQRWRFTAYGILSSPSSGTATLNIGIYYGGFTSGTALCTSGTFTPTASLSSAWWGIQVEMEVRSVGSSGTTWAQGWIDIPTSATAVTRQQMSGTSQTVTINTTASSTLTCGAVWSSAVSGNTVTCEGWIIEQMD